MSTYIGRFAPSPSGPLHAGSLIAAMASYLDARAHGGRWLVRMEDIDEARSVAGAAASILDTLAALGMVSDAAVLVQSQRWDIYARAFAQLAGHTYPCGCSRREIADSRIGLAADGSAIYPGTCRAGLAPGKSTRALRLKVPAAGEPNEAIVFEDRWQGPMQQHLAAEAGDFVLFRADGFWAYQLAVVVDDAAQGITHVVRGLDLLESTGRQIYLQRLLHLSTPQYLHVPVLCNDAGEKLSKQTGAAALDVGQPVRMLEAAARFLGLDVAGAPTTTQFWARAVPAWEKRLLQMSQFRRAC